MYLVNAFSLFSILRCLIHSRVRAEPTSLVAPVNMQNECAIKDCSCFKDTVICVNVYNSALNAQKIVSKLKLHARAKFLFTVLGKLKVHVYDRPSMNPKTLIPLQYTVDNQSIIYTVHTG